jgi:hypothetical protein
MATKKKTKTESEIVDPFKKFKEKLEEIKKSKK